MFLLVLFLAHWEVAAGAVQQPGPVSFHHEGILGTSFDLQVNAADPRQAALVEEATLAEIERLRKILSTYDPASEISRVNAADGPVACSPELIDILSFYDWWTAKSGGAYNGHLGDLITAWKAAEKTGTPPPPAILQSLTRSLAQPGWLLNRPAHTVTRTNGTLDVNSLGKGYIISKAIVAARARVSAIQGILLNIGGDMFAGGMAAPGTPWVIGIANPMHSEDNAPPLTQVRLSERAISTSAAYERGYTVGGKRYSHIFDPRTGYPAEGVASATVIAANNANANALATTLCVLKPEEGLALTRSLPDMDCLIVTPDGRQLRTPGFARYEIPQAAPPSTTPTAATPPAGKPGGWPAGYQVSITINLKTPTNAGGKGGIRRPYVAVWVEDSDGKRVRTVAVWGNAPRYLPDLLEWWKLAQQNQAWAATVTRATRPAGQHKIVWDGLDDTGKPLPTGTYTIVLEVNRQHGSHAIENGKIDCNGIRSEGTLPAASEFGQTQLSYGPSS